MCTYFHFCDDFTVHALGPSHSDFSPENLWVNCFKLVLIVPRKLEFVLLPFPIYFNKTGGAGDMLAPPIANFETKLGVLIFLDSF